MRSSAIYLDHGQIIFATTNSSPSRSATSSSAKGRITRDQYDESVAPRARPASATALTLVEMKAAHRRRSLHGRPRADRRDHLVGLRLGFGHGQLHPRPRQAPRVRQGRHPRSDGDPARRPPRADARSLVARLGTKTTLFARSTGTPRDWCSTPTSSTCSSRRRPQGPLRAGQHAAAGSADNARILYAFFALGLIVPREPRQIKVQLKTDGGKYA